MEIEFRHLMLMLPSSDYWRQRWDEAAYRLSVSMANELIRENEIDIGDEVFIIGLFTHHHAEEEKIQTSQHLMDAYLIEARSTSGLRG